MKVSPILLFYPHYNFFLKLFFSHNSITNNFVMLYIYITTKIMINKHNALIFSEKKGERIIGVLVRLRFFL